MIERICWLVLAICHLPPFMAFFKPSLITKLYSIPVDNSAFLLLHHRAALFGLVVVACLWAAFDSNVSRLAVVITALSMLSFLSIYFMNGAPNNLRGIAIADMIGIPFLAYVAWKAFLAV